MTTTPSANQQLVLNQLRNSLAHIVTEYDRKEAAKRFYNPYALAQYLGAIQEVCDELAGKPEMLTRQAIVNHFDGRLCEVILKALGFRGQDSREWNREPPWEPDEETEETE